jgi:hypothetical protein
MDEYIKREALFNFADKAEKKYQHTAIRKMLDMKGLRYLAQLIPAADVVEVKRGRWEESDDGDRVVCSVCREDFCNIYLEVDRFKYCPSCGAKMDGGV